MNNELYHYGILGMKWGVRRFQNKDGSLTSRGKSRKKSKESDIPAHEDYSKAHNKKSVKSMSDAELRARLNRLQMEKNYQTLMGDENVGKGKKIANGLLKAATTTAAVSGTLLTLYNNGDKIKKILDPLIKDKIALDKAKWVL